MLEAPSDEGRSEQRSARDVEAASGAESVARRVGVVGSVRVTVSVPAGPSESASTTPRLRERINGRLACDGGRRRPMRTRAIS